MSIMTIREVFIFDLMSENDKPIAILKYNLS